MTGFKPFFGTQRRRAARGRDRRPRALRQPGRDGRDVREAFDATALDLVPAGVDGRTGHGILRADSVLDYTGATPQPLVRGAAARRDARPTGDGDAYLEPGESAHAAAAGEERRRRHGHRRQRDGDDGRPRAVVTPRTQSYGDMPHGATRVAGLHDPARRRLPAGQTRAFDRTGDVCRRAVADAGDVLAAHRPAGNDGAKFTYTGPAVPIPDNSTLGATVTIPVTGIGYASKLRFSVDGATCTTTAGSTDRRHRPHLRRRPDRRR